MSNRLFLLCFCTIILHSCTLVRDDSVAEKEKQVVFRQIGNRILWSQGDSTTRILPIEKKGDETYIISFGKQFNSSIAADSLYMIVNQELRRTGDIDFVAELKDCQSGKVFLSFLYHNPLDSLTPCIGRDFPGGCYTLEITIHEKGIAWEKKATTSILLLLPLTAFVYFYAKKRGNKRVPKAQNEQETAQRDIAQKDVAQPNSLQSNLPHKDLPQIGTYRFDKKERVLYHSHQKISLTEKEAQLLSLLLQGVNQIQHRDYLMKEIWGNNDIVVIPKNLDVLVSKLRKKFTLDENIRITNAHGTGYKLEIT